MDAALADAEPAVFWLDRPDAPEPAPPLTGATATDLLIVGGGYTGLWAALQAKERDPAREVTLVEGRTVAFGGSGRNGGFCEASVTHGLHNGVTRFGDDIDALLALGRENLAGLRADLDRHAIECDLEATGMTTVATRPHEVPQLRESLELEARHGEPVRWLDAEQMRAQVDSPTFLAGVHNPEGCVLLQPARLAWGLRRAALDAGVQLHEHTPVTGLHRHGAGVRAVTPQGTIEARRVLLATNAFPPLLRAIRRYVVPVYDYVLVTEPLSAEQRASVGWDGRQGLSDAGNQFHYFRLTPDDRILWGGYDAIYHYGNAVADALNQRPETFALLARQFFACFPQLRGLRFTHRWGGAIDTCSRFSVMFGTAMRGQVAYAVGYTGLGVGASRFGARVALDLLDDPASDLLRLPMVRRRPLPFPPEPLRFAAIELTRRSLAREDDTGRRNAWLRTLDRLGLGFDS
ncbi:MAG TPA: FAD-dependent oxidoreductase [Solirubrobacteraceae bacterium]